MDGYPWRVNMRLFFAFMLVSFNLYAAGNVSWYDFEYNQKTKLTQSIQLKQLHERSGSLIEIKQGDGFVLRNAMGLGSLNVVLFTFDYLNCPGPQMRTDMEIIPVKNTYPVVEIGAQLTQNCKLEIFVENKDLMTKSFFE